MRSTDLLTIALLSLAGLAAAFAATGPRRPEPRLGEVGIHREPLRMQRTAGDPLRVTEKQWLELPMLREDFDLLLDVELGEGSELDLVLRRVESRPLQGVSRGHHSRFAVLRLSTSSAGEPWRTPTTALFGEAGGVRLAAGMSATVRIEGRGRVLTANVAGKALPPFVVEDDHGSFAMIARGGTAAVRSLQIDAVVRREGVPLLFVGPCVGLLLGLLARSRRAAALRTVLAGLAWALAAFVGARVAAAGLVPLTQFESGDELLLFAAGLPLAAAIALGGRAATVLAVPGLAIVAFVAQHVLGDVRARHPATPELDATFGPASRDTATETLARRVRGPFAVHTPEPGAVRVFLLGGQLLYRRGGAPDQHVEPLLQGELGSLRNRVPPDVEVVTLPTEDGWSTQQVRMFDLCFRSYAPAAIVLGVPSDEAAEVDGVPRSSPNALRAAIERARAVAEAMHSHLVLLADDPLPAELRAVVDEAKASGLPLVAIEPTDAAIGIARKLAAVIAPALPAPK